MSNPDESANAPPERPAGVTRADAAAGTAGADRPAGDAERSGTCPEPAPGARPASDFMVDVLRTLGLRHVAINPASSIRGLHESIVNYGGNRAPELLTCTHEEIAVAIAHGYAKAADRPMGVMMHGTVGLQHATMAVYNAWCDRAPVMMFVGNRLRAEARRSSVDWVHSMQDPGTLVRDCVKWDDQPMSLQHFADSAVRAHRIAMTSPRGPVLVVCDSELQEGLIRRPEALSIPKATLPAQPQGDTAALREAAKLLAAAEKPLIIADRACRSQQGVRMMVDLAETLGAPVVDLGSRVNFPSTHDLNLSFVHWSRLRDADVLLFLEAGFPWGGLQAVDDGGEAVQQNAGSTRARIVSISMRDVFLKSNYQDFQRFQPADLAISGDVEATLPDLLEAVKREMPAERRPAIERRRSAIAGLHREMASRDREAARRGRDASPVHAARLADALWETVRHEEWSLVFSQDKGWPRRLWPVTEYHQMLGGSGGAGIGYAAAGALGAALANRERGLVSVTLQPDGDLMYVPGVLWTAAHHRIPLLYVMFNNRGYFQTKSHLQELAARRNRPQDAARVGNEITDPEIDFSRLAQSMGVWAEGPIRDPERVAPALQRALAEVKDGRPALVDVVCQRQPRPTAT